MMSILSPALIVVWIGISPCQDIPNRLTEANASTSLQAAERAFFSGDYAEAAKAFDEVVKVRSDWPGTFYLNQGNAHWLAGHPGAAILAYRRAEQLLPNDPWLFINLQEARSDIADAQLSLYPHATWWRRTLRFPGSFALLGNCLACLVFLVGWSRQVWTRSMVIVMILGWGSGALWLTEKVLEERDASQMWAVVLAPTVPLRQGNGLSYPAQEWQGQPITLHSGVEMKVLLRRSNGWLWVELAGGLRGWIPETMVGVVGETPK
jgi:hypothetical protein